MGRLGLITPTSSSCIRFFFFEFAVLLTARSVRGRFRVFMQVLEIVRADSETAAGAMGAAEGIDAIVEAGHKMADEDSCEGGNKMKEFAEAYGCEGKDPDAVHLLPPPGGVAMFDVQVFLKKTREGIRMGHLRARGRNSSGERCRRAGQRRPRTQGKA